MIVQTLMTNKYPPITIAPGFLVIDCSYARGGLFYDRDRDA